MTSDKDYLGKGNIDRFDALYFHAFYVNTNDNGKKQNLTVSFLKLVQWQPQPKSKTQPFWV